MHYTEREMRAAAAEGGWAERSRIAASAVNPILWLLVFGGATDSMVQSLILLALVAALGGTGAIPGLHPSWSTSAAALAILMLIMASFVSVGLILGALMESPEGFQLVSSFLLFPTFFLSGALFPLYRLPPWLAPLVLLDPLTYGVDALRHADLGVLVAFTLAVIVIGSAAFRRMKI